MCMIRDKNRKHLSLSLLLRDKASLFLSLSPFLTNSALERREQLLGGGSDDAGKSNHIGRSIIKTTLSTFVSFLSIL
jgi:hypothetical protein